MKSKILTSLAVAFLWCLGIFSVAYIGFCIGRFDIIKTQDGGYIHINLKEAYLTEKNIANASLELNHLFYSNDDNDYWYDIIINTPEYVALDSALGGDWKDFYHYQTPLMWDSITYGYSY